MNNFKDLDSLYNKKAKLYKNIKIEKKVEICDLTLESDGEEMAGLKFKESERLEIAKYLTRLVPIALQLLVIHQNLQRVILKVPKKFWT